MSEIYTASHSEVESFLRCQRAHYYSYGELLQSKHSSDALTRGILGHAGLAEYFKAIQADEGVTKIEAFKAAMRGIRESAETYNEDVDDIRSEVTKLVKLYIDYNWQNDCMMDIIAVEKRYDVQITDTFVMPIIIDLLAVPAGGELTVYDHKFLYNFLTPTGLNLLPQLPRYVKALRNDGWDVNHAVYNTIRYRNTKDNESDPSERFKRQPITLSTARVNTTMREHILVAKQIANLREFSKERWEKTVVRAASDRVCNTCSFNDLCVSDLNRNQGRDLMIQFDYKTRERRVKEDAND